jgi:hypothetical protein
MLTIVFLFIYPRFALVHCLRNFKLIIIKMFGDEVNKNNFILKAGNYVN